MLLGKFGFMMLYPRLRVDESGTLLEDLIPEMIDYASDTGEELDDGDFTPEQFLKMTLHSLSPIQILPRDIFSGLGLHRLCFPRTRKRSGLANFYS